MAREPYTGETTRLNPSGSWGLVGTYVYNGTMSTIYGMSFDQQRLIRAIQRLDLLCSQGAHPTFEYANDLWRMSLDLDTDELAVHITGPFEVTCSAAIQAAMEVIK